jgi:hypothetical protein
MLGCGWLQLAAASDDFGCLRLVLPKKTSGMDIGGVWVLVCCGAEHSYAAHGCTAVPGAVGWSLVKCDVLCAAVQQDLWEWCGLKCVQFGEGYKASAAAAALLLLALLPSGSGHWHLQMASAAASPCCCCPLYQSLCRSVTRRLGVCPRPISARVTEHLYHHAWWMRHTRALLVLALCSMLASTPRKHARHIAASSVS